MPKELVKLQQTIEAHTSELTDPEKVYRKYPHILDILVHKDKPSVGIIQEKTK
jgi:hypothetical protein